MYIHIHTCTYMYIHVHTYTYVFMYMYVFCTYYICIYTHIRDSLVKSPQWEPSIPQQLNTNVIRGACETCTTSVKRAQLLANEDNFYEFDDKFSNTAKSSQSDYTHIDIYIYIYRDMTVYVYIPQVRGWHLRFHPDAFRGAPIRRAAPGSIPRRHRGASTAAWRLQG